MLPRLAQVTLAFFALTCGKSAESLKLDRGLVALRHETNAVFLSWRWLETDPGDAGFNVYRGSESQLVRLNPAPLTNSTHFIDSAASPTQELLYAVALVVNGREIERYRSRTIPAHAPVQPYLSIPLQTQSGYAPNDGSIGDLDGDGNLEIVLHQAGRGRDNSRPGFTSEPLLEAYTLEGKFLWRINLGKNIREGAHYTQFIVYDLDGDGRAEIMCKTADGTADGRGKIIGDPAADWRDQNGRTAGKVLRGPEFLTVFDGFTGAELATTNYIPPRGEVASWGDDYGNRVDRFLACVAYLDGSKPSAVFCRGYYTRAVLAAWKWRDGKLTHQWTFDSDAGPAGNRAYRGQGNHNLTVADVDQDGRDEIVYGAAVIDDNGQGLYSTGLGHGDALHVSDLDPARPGLEVLTIQEKFGDAGVSVRNARTGEIYWKLPSVRAGRDGEGPGRGVAFDIDPRHLGHECWVAGAGITGLYNVRGERIAERPPRSCNFAIWWDGDLLRELLDRNYISKWNWRDGTESMLLVATDCVSNNGSKATPVLSADILGDWREEVIWRTEDNQSLRIFTTPLPTARRFRPLLADRHYRLSVISQNTAYNQPPHTSFFMGPPRAIE